jgi:elongation factor G
MEPHAGTERVLLNQTGVSSVAPELIDASMEELASRLDGGGIFGGFPLANIKVTLLACEARDQGSNEVAFRIAAGDAFERALRDAGPVLLEPIMKLEVSTPEEFLGDFVGDLQQRRAIIAAAENRGGTSVIEAHAPLAELFGYSGAMRSLSQGRASCSMEPFEYSPAPAKVAESFAI